MNTAVIRLLIEGEKIYCNIVMLNKGLLERKVYE